MNHRMNEAHDLMEQAMVKVRRATLHEVLDLLINQCEQIRRLLENGRPFMEQASGYRFERIYNCRAKLWAKLASLDEAQSAVIDLL